jgi:hypothetical protein
MLSAADQDRTVLARDFGPAAINAEFGFFVLPDIDPVEPRLEDIKRSVGGMDLEIPFAVRCLDPEIKAAGEKMKVGRILVLAGKGHDVDLGESVEAEEILAAELELGAAVLGPDFVAFDDNQVHFGLFIAHVLTALDENIALDIAHPDIAAVVVALRLAGSRERDKGKNRRDDETDLFHLRSPSNRVFSKKHARIGKAKSGGKNEHWEVIVLQRGQ